MNSNNMEVSDNLREKSVYLTIDDAPSENFLSKTAYLKQHNIPATFFCIGEKLERRFREVVDAIGNGFVIGNHSYSHIKFSDLTLHQIREEIIKTEDLIGKAYAVAGIPRPIKLFRFPYGDKGFHRFNQSKALLPSRVRCLMQELNGKYIQNILVKEGFRQPSFTKGIAPCYVESGLSNNFDVFWTFDTKDYVIQNLEQFASWIKSGFYEDTLYRKSLKRGCLLDDQHDDIILAHDYNDNYQHCITLVNVFLEHNIKICPLPIESNKK